MDNDKLLSSLSEHIAYWYTSVKGEKEIIFPINNVTKEKANQLFMDRYYEADVIISEKGEIYKISKEICCQSNIWSYFYYLDDMKKNYRLKRICKEILPYDLKSTNEDKFNQIVKIKIPCKVVTIKLDKNEINQVKELIKPYLKCFTYINSKKRKVIAYPDLLLVKNDQITLLLNYYHHHHMERQIKKINKIITKNKVANVSSKNNY